jgi:hypothetical protein
MAPRSPRAAARSKLDLNPRISAPSPRDLTRTPLPMVSSSPSTGPPMKTVSRPPVTTSPLLPPCPSTSSRCSPTWRPPVSCKRLNLLISAVYVHNAQLSSSIKSTSVWNGLVSYNNFLVRKWENQNLSQPQFCKFIPNLLFIFFIEQWTVDFSEMRMNVSILAGIW